MSTRSTERKSVYVEGQNFEADIEGYIAVPENLGHIDMVLPGFTYVGGAAQTSESLNRPNLRRQGMDGLRPSRWMISGSRFVGTSMMRGYPGQSPS